MELTVFRLQPHGAFHFGDQGIDLESVLETCPSDTLYAALTWLALQNGAPWALESIPKPPFRLSSCFPYVDTIQLMPIPNLPPPLAERQQQIPGERKKFKKVRFVSLDIFRHLLAGGSLRDYFAESKGAFLQNGTVLVSINELQASSWDADKPIWKHEDMPHVAIDRVSNATQYYETGQIRFNEGCGLSVLATGDIGQLEALLTELGHFGLGGRRSKGLGQFKLEKSDSIQLAEPPTNPNCQVLLSRYIPTLAELKAHVLGEHASYNLEQVTGWFYSPTVKAQRRKSIWMLKAGSVVQKIEDLHGDIVDIKPTYANPANQIHEVWRHGLALAVNAVASEEAQ